MLYFSLTKLIYFLFVAFLASIRKFLNLVKFLKIYICLPNAPHSSLIINILSEKLFIKSFSDSKKFFFIKFIV